MENRDQIRVIIAELIGKITAPERANMQNVGRLIKALIAQAKAQDEQTKLLWESVKALGKMVSAMKEQMHGMLLLDEIRDPAKGDPRLN